MPDSTKFITLANLSTYKGLADADVISKIKNLPSLYTNPSQSAGKYLVSDGEKILFVNKIEDKAIFFPNSGANSVTLTGNSALPQDINQFNYIVYRNGLYLTDNVDYVFNDVTSTFTFNETFGENEVVVVLLGYQDEEASSGYRNITLVGSNNTLTVTPEVGSNNKKIANTEFVNNAISTALAGFTPGNNDSYEAGTNITFTENQSTGKITISATQPDLTSYVTSTALNTALADYTPTSELLENSEIKISSIHHPTAETTSITLTSTQKPASNIQAYGMSVYRNGIYLLPDIDYTYNSSNGVITFNRAFIVDEAISINFSYLTNDNVTYNTNASQYEAGTNITFTENQSTGKITISATQPDISEKANTSDLATVATSGSYNDLSDKPTLFSGSYDDLSNKPTIPDVSNFITSSDLSTALSDYAELNDIPDTSNFVTSSNLNTTLSNYVQSSSLESLTAAEVESIFDTATGFSNAANQEY